MKHRQIGNKVKIVEESYKIHLDFLEKEIKSNDMNTLQIKDNMVI